MKKFYQMSANKEVIEMNQLMRVKIASEYFDVTEKTIHNWIKKGSIPSKKIGGTVYVITNQNLTDEKNK